MGGTKAGVMVIIVPGSGSENDSCAELRGGAINEKKNEKRTVQVENLKSGLLFILGVKLFI